MLYKSKKQLEREEAERRKSESKVNSINMWVWLMVSIVLILFQHLDFGLDSPTDNIHSYAKSRYSTDKDYSYNTDRAIGMGNAYTNMQKFNNRATVDSKINSYYYAKFFDMSSN